MFLKSKTPGPRYALAAICAITFLFYFATFMRMPLIPLYAQGLGATVFQVGVIAASFMVVAALLGFPMGYISDRRGRKVMIVSGLGVSTFASALIPFTTDVTQIAAVYMLAGVGMGTSGPALAAIVGDVSKTTAMASSYGWFSTTMHVGMAGGPALGGIIAGSLGFSSAFIWSAVISLMAFAVALIFISEPRIVKAGIVLDDDQKDERTGFRPNRMVALGWMGALCYSFALGVIHPFFPLYATSVGIGLGAFGVLFSTMSLANAVARIPMGYLSDRLGSRIPFIVLGLLAMSAVTVATVSTDSYALLLVIFAMLGFAGGTTTMTISTSLAESAPPGTRGMAMGGQGTARYTGFAGSPLIVGALLPAVGFVPAFAAVASLCVFGSIAYTMFGRKNNGD